MSTILEFDEYLGQDFSANYWSDDAILYAQELVQRLTPREWADLESVWPKRSAAWRQRFAQVLDWGDPRYAVAMLVDMAQTADGEVVAAAADSLRTLQDDGVDVLLPPAAERRLRAVAAQGGLNAIAIRALVDRARPTT